MIVDLPLSELQAYEAPSTGPADFDAFWEQTLAEARSHPLDARFERIEAPMYQLVDVDDVTFNGWGGQPVKGWLIRPRDAKGELPCLITYIGYGGGRSLPVDHVAPAVAGFAHFVMDTRGQGSAGAPGDTADDAGAGPHYPGFMTRGIESREAYYYRRVFTDAVRATEAAASHENIDGSRVGVVGTSQGGGIAIAAAGLAPDRVKLLAADVPFLCHYRRATEISDRMPYGEITAYLKCHRNRIESVFRTLAYFDGVNFAPRIKARSLFSVGLMDLVCPPSTVFAAYNRVPVDKDIRIYEFNEHEGGGTFQMLERLRFAAEHL